MRLAGDIHALSNATPTPPPPLSNSPALAFREGADVILLHHRLRTVNSVIHGVLHGVVHGVLLRVV